ncbi:Glycosyl transferase family 2 [Lachnospiraceae bacterium]|nr:Glycosyl transferase family 2 [Lachnospiraceae bacterium]
MSKKVSVIVPVYKTENYIVRCVESLIGQTYKDLEILLVDDGSPDNAGKICDEYADKDARVKVIHQKNAGQSAARNNALKLATGDYFCFVDSDDYIASDMIEKLYRLTEDNSADIAMVDYLTFTGEKAEASGEKAEISFMNNMQMIRNIHTVKDELYVVMWGKLFKRELFNGIEFAEGRICEDLDVLYRLYDKAQKSVYSSEKLYYYFRGNVSSSTFGLNQKFYDDVFWVLEREIRYIDEKYPDLSAYPRRTYMYWIVDLAKKKGGIISLGELKQVYKRYREMYRESRSLKKEKFFTFFYYLPSLYVLLKKR